MKFLTPSRVKAVNAEAIRHLVEDAYGYPHGTLQRRTNEPHIAHPRHLAAFLLLENGLSTVRVGKCLNKHHTTVMHSREVVKKLLQEDAELRACVDKLQAAIVANPGKFLSRPQRVMSVIEPPVKKPLPPPLLPNVASHRILGMGELDRLITSGRGDAPRIRVEELNRRRA